MVFARKHEDVPWRFVSLPEGKSDDHFAQLHHLHILTLFCWPQFSRLKSSASNNAAPKTTASILSLEAVGWYTGQKLLDPWRFGTRFSISTGVLFRFRVNFQGRIL